GFSPPQAAASSAARSVPAANRLMGAPILLPGEPVLVALGPVRRWRGVPSPRGGAAFPRRATLSESRDWIRARRTHAENLARGAFGGDRRGPGGVRAQDHRARQHPEDVPRVRPPPLAPEHNGRALRGRDGLGHRAPADEGDAGAPDLSGERDPV